MIELTKRSGLKTPDKEYKELQEMFKRMEDRTYDDKIRSKNEKK